ncbi:hypothetical protein SERLADRAFT_450239 [Serpula lacrymans var. lacrymans S7.9]|uniref:Uncharacterized protein n=1 Tax=Serpula lacrymans var. lacrymans (strain S7.9) TaxID=578457 RepID=F8NZB8_SERL9|nr:uncharacterized protein SERLADRAFT_450239 [Serpula lacrymans var. lacrymans S7.9]EGO23938.1 hypothetical protein SERLADRAFT_450239 [Serpula lacrymans var. lacrymans S7.9]
MADEVIEGKIFATFEKYDEFLAIQKAFLVVDLTTEPNDEQDKDEIELLRKLCFILGEYQEQSYLLDPFLESLVIPVVDCLRRHATMSVSSPDRSTTLVRIGRLAVLLYNYIKCLRFFPHEVEDLSIALGFLQLCGGPTQITSQWPLRYIVLLWLSLICRLPFDLEQFDERDRVGDTANNIESLAKSHLGRAGLEREGAAILLSRLYMRKDTQTRYAAFLVWSIETLNNSPDTFTSIALLQVICENVKAGSAEQTQQSIDYLLKISGAIDQNEALRSNTLVRKLKTKMVSRIALRLIPPKVKVARKVRSLTTSSSDQSDQYDNEDIEVSEAVEGILEDLFRCLQDKDTVVRWSAAKGVARLAERLPTDFSNQVLETILGLFTIHSIAAATVYDMPTIAEATWHGACLASAEMARRGLVSGSYLSELVTWLSKALYFDIRKGAHSIGSNVRDAAAYVIWAIARAQDPAALQPFSLNLAQRLVTVSLYDREIHIRRAASAAFQENVGRTGLFPHGISVLRQTDFYAVSIRRNAFIVVAPQVAEHLEYRSSLIDHLLLVTLRHWDVTMRQLGAQSLRVICELDLHVLGPSCLPRLAQLFESVDIVDIHGGLLALTELADAYRLLGQTGDDKRRQIFKYITKIPQGVILAPRNELVLAATCHLIATTITLPEIELKDDSAVPYWRKIVDQGLRHRNDTVQEAAAASMAAISSLVSAIFDTLEAGLDDYTTDERGDIGSWIRMACIKGLTSSVEVLFSNASCIANFAQYIPPSRYHSALAKILQQGVERLDNVRQVAGECFLRLLELPLPAVENANCWRIKGESLMKNLEAEIMSWSNGGWLFAKAVQMLEIEEYRKPILKGIILSIGTRTDSTQRPASSSLIAYSNNLPVSLSDTGYSLGGLARDLIDYAQSHVTSNAVVVPVLQTFNLLLEADALARLPQTSEGLKCLDALVSLTTRNISRLKSVQRIQESMKAVMNLLMFPTVAEACIPQLAEFLGHSFPRVRASAAEYLYLVLQTKDVGFEAEEGEDILLETEWSTIDVDEAKKIARQFSAWFSKELTSQSP